MSDIKFDIETMELVIENGDFVLELNPSVQNGGLILYTKNAFLIYPLLGIGINSMRNLNQSQIQKLLYKWQSQVVADGANSALATVSQNSKNQNIFDINYQCDYSQ